MYRADPSGPVRVSGEGALRGVRRSDSGGQSRPYAGGGQGDRGRIRRRRPAVVIKAQVKTGGRGKAGGVKLATGPDETEAKARQILGMDIKGHTVHTVLVATDT